MLLNDTLTPEERIREFDDLERCIRLMEKNITEHPESFPDGISMKDEEEDFELIMYADEKGAYAALKRNGITEGISVDLMVELAKRHYLLTHSGYELLACAVIKSGRKKVITLGPDTLTLDPKGNDVEITYEEG